MEVDDCTSPEIQPINQRQPRIVWLVVDFACMLAVGLTCLLFRLVAVPYHRGFYCDDDSINKPYKESTVPSSVLYSVGFTLAYLVIFVAECCSQRSERKSEDVCIKIGPLKFSSLLIRLCNLFGTFAFGGLISIFVTDIGKYTVGRLRPHFLSICNPPPSIMLNCSHSYIMDDVCAGDPGLLREGRLSFPSGHASFSGINFILCVGVMHVQCMHLSMLSPRVRGVGGPGGIWHS